MAKNVLGSSTSYTGDGGTSLFSISFALGTINVDQIKVYLDDVLKTNITDYTIVNNDSQVQFTTAPVSGTIIDIRREQDDNSVEVDYQDTKQVKEKDLDNSNKALYYLLHELFDGWLGNRFKLRANLNANNKKIINLRDAVNPQDAVNLRKAQGLLATLPVAQLDTLFSLVFQGNVYTSDNKVYDLSGVIPVNIVQSSIFINGIKQLGGNSYTVLGKVITFTGTLLDTDTLEVHVNLASSATTPVITTKSTVNTVATAGQTLVSAPSYVIGNKDLLVFVNGIYQKESNYTETDATSITFTSGLMLGDDVNIKRIQ